MDKTTSLCPAMPSYLWRHPDRIVGGSNARRTGKKIEKRSSEQVSGKQKAPRRIRIWNVEENGLDSEHAEKISDTGAQIDG
jgi:hypothetical protein